MVKSLSPNSLVDLFFETFSFGGWVVQLRECELFKSGLLEEKGRYLNLIIYNLFNFGGKWYCMHQLFIV
jgi:hypothetical protein